LRRKIILPEVQCQVEDGILLGCDWASPDTKGHRDHSKPTEVAKVNIFQQVNW
jgi:hypothetical protein